jgi:hypothetical protein
VRLSVVLAVVLVAVAGCGGSSTPSHTSSAPTPTLTRPPAPVKTVQSSPPKTTTRATAPPAATTTTGASNVRLPATFTIISGAKLSPPTVSAPAGVAVQLTVLSRDGKAHQVAVASHRLSVPAGGSASAVLSGLGKGNYPLSVDGVKRGTLVIGVAPGP